MESGDVLKLLHETADAVVAVFADHDDWGPSGGRPDQYASDVVADAAALEVLGGAGLRVLSEESGLGPGDGPVVVIDPLDGSTNASRFLPWFATSLCVVDDAGPSVAVVHDHGRGHRYDAVRDGGARLDGRVLEPSAPRPLDEAIVAVNGVPPPDAGWAQFRAMGAAALDLCAVADGRFDGYVDFDGGLACWDYLGALLVCREVGVAMSDALDRDLIVLDHTARRQPVAARPELVGDLRRIQTAG